jgi:hypothetical protein
MASSSKKVTGGQHTDYHIAHRILIGVIILVALYHISTMRLAANDQILYFYIIMLEMVGIIYEYYG